MRQNEINKDLGSYMHERKGAPFWKKYKVKIPKRKDEDVELAIRHSVEQMAAKENISPEDREELEVMEGQISQVNKVESEVEKVIDDEREGVLHKFFKKLNFSSSDKEEEKIEHEAVVMSDNPEIQMSDEELRQLLHGLHNWIIQLPADKLERFKNSKEFELYTKYLRKHNLIK